MAQYNTPELWNSCIYNQRINHRLNNSPKSNIIERENEIIVELAIPGFLKEQIEILIENDSLFIGANLKSPNSDSTQYRGREFSIEPFGQVYKISSKMNMDEIQAQLQNGILSLTITKKAEQKMKSSKQIEINKISYYTINQNTKRIIKKFRNPFFLLNKIYIKKS